MAHDNPSPQRVHFDIAIPQITPAGQQAAMKLANATFVFDIDGRKEEFLAAELTPEVIDAEAARLATLQDPEQRKNEIRFCIEACLMLVREAQTMATVFSGQANSLAALTQTLTALAATGAAGLTIRIEDI